ncbi:MAG: glutathione S-transferase family protein [Pseudomonadota bacterium]
MAAHALLEEIGAPFDLIPTEIFTDRPDPDFLKISPNARVPALLYEGETGWSGLCESGAIAFFLADRHPEAGLSLTNQDPRRGLYLQWLFYLSSTLQPDVLIQFHPEALFPDQERQKEIKDASMARLSAVWRILNEAIEGPYMFGKQPTACDHALGLQAIWPECFANSVEEFPKVAKLVQNLTERPAVKRILTWHGY